jgi:Flp pilus assembly protein TadG
MSLWKCAQAVSTDKSGTIAVVFSVAAPVLMGAIGLAVDGSRVLSERSRLQTVADLSALASAKELRLANATAASIDVVTTNFVNTNLIIGGVLPPVTVRTQVPPSKATITVEVTKHVDTYILKHVAGAATSVRATATARIIGGNPVCMVALDERSKNTLVLTQGAKLTAPKCEIYSNSRATAGLSVMDQAQLTAGGVCSAGGKYANKGSITPEPRIDCPVLSDPLAKRLKPAVPIACDHVNKKIDGGTGFLFPGAYCGGLYITGGAKVTLNPGVYIINGGPLMVDQASALTGKEVGFYLTGLDASFYFGLQSTIGISAPSFGAMAGMLIWQDRSVTISLPGVPPPPGKKPPVVIPPLPKLGKGIPKFRDPVNQVLSDDARTLLGTIYLPDGALYIDANKPIADSSAYTIIVAREIGLAAGPNLVLNSNYAATTVPVPAGVGLIESSVRLEK